jgi:hypothetical protein
MELCAVIQNFFLQLMIQTDVVVKGLSALHPQKKDI